MDHRVVAADQKGLAAFEKIADHLDKGFRALGIDEVPGIVHQDRLYGVGPATPLDGGQLGELGRDGCHRLFRSAQAASRAEEGADFAESFIRRLVHDGNEQFTC